MTQIRIYWRNENGKTPPLSQIMDCRHVIGMVETETPKEMESLLVEFMMRTVLLTGKRHMIFDWRKRWEKYVHNPMKYENPSSHGINLIYESLKGDFTSMVSRQLGDVCGEIVKIINEKMWGKWKWYQMIFFEQTVETEEVKMKIRYETFDKFPKDPSTPFNIRPFSYRLEYRT